MSCILEVKDLSFSYSVGVPVLKHVSLQLEHGDIMMLMGPNGCGKTTLMKLILRLLPAAPQPIMIQGRSQSDYSTAELARTIAYVPQMGGGMDCDYSVREFLLMGRAPHIGVFQLPSRLDYEIVERSAEECGIAELLEIPVRQLSGGQYQLVTIARTLVQEAELIIMDEPLSALDLRNQARMLKMLLRLRDRGNTVLLSTHDPNHALALHCTVCSFLDGTIRTCGPVDNVFTVGLLASMYGEDVALQTAGTQKSVVFRDIARQ